MSKEKKKQITGNNIYTLQVTIDISLSIRACSSDRLARRDHDRPWRSRRPATVAIRQSKQNRKKKINKYRLTKSLYVIYIYPAMIYANAEEHATKSNAKKKQGSSRPRVAIAVGPSGGSARGLDCDQRFRGDFVNA
jgi:16S rRNA U1498 N3-methylase RsmE